MHTKTIPPSPGVFVICPACRACFKSDSYDLGPDGCGHCGFVGRAKPTYEGLVEALDARAAAGHAPFWVRLLLERTRLSRLATHSAGGIGSDNSPSYEQLDVALAACSGPKTAGALGMAVTAFEAKEAFDHYNAACCLAVKDESERALIETIMKKRARVVAELIDDAAFPKKVEEAVEDAVEEPAPHLSEDRPVRPNPAMPQPPDDEALF